MTHRDCLQGRSRGASGPVPLIPFLAGWALLSWVAGCGPGPVPESPSPTDPPLAGSPRRAEPTPKTDLISPPAPPLPSEPSPIRFESAAPPPGVDFVHLSGNSPEKHFPAIFGSGVALIDYDNDGRLDLYFATTRNFPLDAPTTSRGNRLYRNQGDGTFRDVTTEAHAGYRGFCHGLAAADFDADGFTDLYLCNYGPNVLLLNNGDGTFRDASAGSGADCPQWTTAAAPLDFDNDGHLDLYVVNYGHWDYNEKHPYCGDAEKKIRSNCSALTIPPERHLLARNRGDGRFEDVTESSGLLRDDGRGLGVIAVDVNDDGWTDLFVANDECPNFLFLNRGGGRFEDISESSGVARLESGEVMAGMGVDAEDVTGDGRPELIVTNFRHEYDALYRNLDGRLFQDISAWAGLVQETLPDVGWGCALTDFDHDGWPDLLICNGHIDDNLELQGRGTPQAEPTKVFRNRGEGRFRRVADPGPFFRTPHVARGASFGDLDNDGRIDAVISCLDTHPALLWNRSEGGSWIGVELLGRRSNRSAIGAVVRVTAGGRTWTRQVKGGGSYLAANDLRVVVGLGQARAVERVEVRWPSGDRSVLEGPEPGRYHLVREQAAAPKRVADARVVR